MIDKQHRAGERKLPPKNGRPAKPRPNRNLYKLVPVRLPVDKWDLFSKEADELGIGASTLARIWILEALRKLNNNNHNGD